MGELYFDVGEPRCLEHEILRVRQLPREREREGIGRRGRENRALAASSDQGRARASGACAARPRL